ncbi:MAG: sigma-54 dependent transcriptional regulator [candidate division KSB1 bacterium]|nr:sigma-54 dependent transcriptional regulator [candidate division KSB1 bacterium]
MKPKILVADDEIDTLILFRDVFNEKGYVTITAEDGQKALTRIDRESFNVVLTDLKMPGLDGLQLLTKVKEKAPDTEVIVFTGYGSVESAVEAMKKGAYDYVTKPIKMEEVLLLIERILYMQSLKTENRLLHTQLDGRYSFENIIGRNQKMQKIFELIRDVASTQSTVLIRGESGTGKELIAHAIHYNSPRRNNRLVKVNCAVLAETLLESELFGHVKGAFTGAHRDKVGRFEMADNGTLFLDEVGDISPALQLKLLRVLQEGEFERVGDTRTIKVDVRIIAATNKDLEKAMASGEFRQDLYYRLNVIPIEIPPLRERSDDIPLLVEHFFNKYKTEVGKNIRGITDEAMRLLTSYHWPGNVRELENLIERAVVLCKSEYIGDKDISPLVISPENRTPMQMLNEKSLPEVLDEIEKDIITNVLREYRNNKSRAARRLGIHRSTFMSKLRKHNLWKV